MLVRAISRDPVNGVPERAGCAEGLDFDGPAGSGGRSAENRASVAHGQLLQNERWVGAGTTEQKPLNFVGTEFLNHQQLRIFFDALDDHAHAHAVGKIHYGTHHRIRLERWR